MKAAVYRKCGPPDVLQIEDVAKPVAKDNEILVRVCATTVTAGDVRFRKADPFFLRALNGLSRPKKMLILGMELAGTVEAVGKAVTAFAPGDEVFGSTGFKFAAYAQYAVAIETLLAKKPRNLPLEDAAPIAFGGVSALHFLRAANVGPGKHVLVYGASGSVGTYAVQLAKHFGARVTGVSSGANLALVKSLGADAVVDYTKEDFSRGGPIYDIVIDTVGKGGLRRSLRSLKRGGVLAFVATGLAAYIAARLWAATTGAVRIVGGVARSKPGDLAFLAQLIESGAIKPVIDRRYTLDQIAEAHRYAETGRKKGNVVVTIE